MIQYSTVVILTNTDKQTETGDKQADWLTATKAATISLPSRQTGIRRQASDDRQAGRQAGRYRYRWVYR